VKSEEVRAAYLHICFVHRGSEHCQLIDACSFLLVALEAYEIANSMEPHDEEVKRNIATLQSILQEKDTSLHAGDGTSGLMDEEERRPQHRGGEKEGTEFLSISTSSP
jgi:hypothetical protein